MKELEIASAELGILAQMMRKFDFFSPLTVGQLDKILPSIMLYSYGRGERVFSQGQKGDALYIVYKGSVNVRLGRWRIFSKTVATLKTGDFFGEIALISAEPRTATVVCAESSLLFTLIADDFKFILEENPAATAEMRRIAGKRKFSSSQQSGS